MTDSLASIYAIGYSRGIASKLPTLMPRPVGRPRTSATRYRIETMAVGHYDDVVRLWRNSEGVGLNESDTRQGITDYLVRNPGMSFVARDGSAIVGAVLCGHDGRRGYLHHLAVAPEHRRHGLGKKLVRACFKQLRLHGIIKCNIFLYADNAAGEAFWNETRWTRRADLVMLQKSLLPSHHPRCC